MLVSCIVLLSTLIDLRGSIASIGKPEVLNCVYNTEKNTIWINTKWSFKSGYSNRVTVNQTLNQDCSVKEHAVFVDDRVGVPSTSDRVHFLVFSSFLRKKIDLFSKGVCLGNN
jgi:hypothetical protein